jgi:hypothetical protein
MPKGEGGMCRRRKAVHPSIHATEARGGRTSASEVTQADQHLLTANAFTEQARLGATRAPPAWRHRPSVRSSYCARSKPIESKATHGTEEYAIAKSDDQIQKKRRKKRCGWVSFRSCRSLGRCPLLTHFFLESIIYRLTNTLHGNRPSWPFDPGPA